jgi:small subunit ribosomal protein S17
MSTQTTTRRTKTGLVVSDAMDKTVAVEIERMVKDPQFKKFIRRKKKFLVHDENGECKRGDLVEIRESRPLSKRKRWRVVRLIKKAEFPQEVNA